MKQFANEADIARTMMMMKFLEKCLSTGAMLSSKVWERKREREIVERKIRRTSRSIAARFQSKAKQRRCMSNELQRGPRGDLEMGSQFAEPKKTKIRIKSHFCETESRVASYLIEKYGTLRHWLEQSPRDTFRLLHRENEWPKIYFAWLSVIYSFIGRNVYGKENKAKGFEVFN